MTEELRSLFQRALEEAKQTYGDVADALGVSQRYLELMRAGQRSTTPAQVEALATYLRSRSSELAAVADQLEQALDSPEDV